MTLIAKKPCSFGGEKFYIGYTIPAEYVINPKDQEKMGVLAIVDGAVPSTSKTPNTSRINIGVKTDEGVLPLVVTDIGVQAVFDVLTSKADDAEDIINEMTDGDALILLHVCDSRKTIKAAAEARAQALNSESEETPEELEEAEETPEEPEDSAGDE